MRSILRWLVLYVAVGLILAIGFGVVSEFFIELAREKGWYTNSSDRLDTAMSAFSSFVTQSWFITMTVTIIAFVSGVWLGLFLRRREQRLHDRPNNALASERSVKPTSGNIDRTNSAAYNELIVFFTDHVAPTLRSMENLQAHILRDLCPNKNVTNLAIHGITSSTADIKEFWNHFEYLEGSFSSSPMDQVGFDDLMKRIVSIDKCYDAFCKQGEQLALSGGIDCRTHKRIGPIREKWRDRHNRLVEQYSRIKRDPGKFPGLFRPGRKSL